MAMREFSISIPLAQFDPLPKGTDQPPETGD
jgi:hypothetical protein